MSLIFYNTLTRTKQPFAPIDPARVRMYVCGPTVYDYAHIGNGRAAIVFDLLFRLLRQVYGADHVIYARNVTDVDDKINARAARDFPGVPLNEAIAQVTSQTLAQYREDVAALGCLTPTHEPRATDHMPEMRALIERLVARGIAYVAQDHVLFSPNSMDALPRAPRYGSLARRSLDEMLAGARVEVAPYKRDPMDFVLWKVGKQGEPDDAIWPSPWGAGRPGWHLECSAMARALLGKTIDIHGGGPDLRFPHHENEIAQSEAANHQPLANWWMHVGQLDIGGDKMSKSLGNFTTLEEAIAQFGGDVVRFYFVRTHYRSPVNFSLAGLEDAASGLERLHNAMRSAAVDGMPLDWDEAHAARFRAAMDEDFNAPAAMAVLFELVGEVNRGGSAAIARQLAELAGMLGLGLPDVVADPEGEAIQALVEARSAARAAKDYAEADRIRAELDARGVIIDDTPNGTLWRRTRGG